MLKQIIVSHVWDSESSKSSFQTFTPRIENEATIWRDTVGAELCADYANLARWFISGGGKKMTIEFIGFHVSIEAVYTYEITA